MARSKQLTYSQALAELEKIIEEIESEAIGVDLLTDKVKRAAHLIRFCKGKLRETDEEVKKILAEMDENTESEDNVAGDLGL